MQPTPEEIELAILDALLQAGVAVGDLHAGTQIATLHLSDIEFDDLADDLEAEFGVAVAREQLRQAPTVRDIVELVHAAAQEKSSRT